MGVHSTILISRNAAIAVLANFNFNTATDDELERILDVFYDKKLLNVSISPDGENDSMLDRDFYP